MLARFLIPLIIAFGVAFMAQASTRIDIPGPPGSTSFGSSVHVLPNGNFVVIDPVFDKGDQTSVGAVYLYRPSGQLISRITGSTSGDLIGNGGVTVLTNGNFVIRSTGWDNGNIIDAGAVTWVDGVTGISGTVSPANSLVGSTQNDRVGNFGVTALTNGNYVVCSPSWNNGSVADVGAATWGDGTTGITGPVSAANSLIGPVADDNIGNGGATALTNGNYVILSHWWNESKGAATWGNGTNGTVGIVSAANSITGSTFADTHLAYLIPLTNGNYVYCTPYWDNGGIIDAGAVTWGSGTTSTSSTISSANSLVGSTSYDLVGNITVTPLVNGNYVVRSSLWDNGSITDAGAATWGDGTTGVTGPITSANSLVGTFTDDQVSSGGITALTNGNYVLRSLSWNATRGAVTWGNGATGTTGAVSSSNSLVGSIPGDFVGGMSITALTNGNYIVRSPTWDNGGIANVGAVTWGDGTTGITGPVSPANSLIGSTAGDQVGSSGGTALANGHYVISSQFWDNGSGINAGAATWGNGVTGTTGTVSTANSLVGTSSNDRVSSSGIIALTNGHYVVLSAAWDNGGVSDVGAATWGNGSTGTVGTVSPANSLIGTASNDQVGDVGSISRGLTALVNGNYVVHSPLWNGKRGAATWGNGSTGTTGPVSAANSLVGTAPNDRVSGAGVTALSNGNYVVLTEDWDDTVATTAAVSLGNGFTGTNGPLSTDNSLRSNTTNFPSTLPFDYDPLSGQVIVGAPRLNLVARLNFLRIRSLAKTGIAAPGTSGIKFAASGRTAVGPAGAVITEYTLTGTGSARGKNRALFASTAPATPLDLILQKGDLLTPLSPATLPDRAVAATLTLPVAHQPQRALFQATASGPGLNASNNRLLLREDGTSVQLLHQTGQPLSTGPLAGAALATFGEFLQSHDQDLITLTYRLKTSTALGIKTSSDTGLLLLDHSGLVSPAQAAREGQPSFGGGGTFGSFAGRTAAAGLGGTLHFSNRHRLTGGPIRQALFRMDKDGTAASRTAQTGDTAPGAAPATFASFTAITQQGNDAIVKATLKGSPSALNEGLWSLPVGQLLLRKGTELDSAALPGVRLTRILRYWPAGTGQLIAHVQLAGGGTTAATNQALILRQADGTILILLRTGSAAPGIAPATLAKFSAIDVNPVSGRYVILGTLKGAPARSNQALWTGHTGLGGDDAIQQVSRLPQLRLRKGMTLPPPAAPLTPLLGIALTPATDPAGAGGRGLAHIIGDGGHVSVRLTTGRNLHELSLLEP